MTFRARVASWLLSIDHEELMCTLLLIKRDYRTAIDSLAHDVAGLRRDLGQLSDAVELVRRPDAPARVSDPRKCPMCDNDALACVMLLTRTSSSDPSQQQVVGYGATCPRHEVPYQFFWSLNVETGEIRSWSPGHGDVVVRDEHGVPKVIEAGDAPRGPRLKPGRP